MSSGNLATMTSTGTLNIGCPVRRKNASKHWKFSDYGGIKFTMNAQKDYEEFFELLNRKKVKYLIVGAHAVGFYGKPRFTGD